MPIERIDSLDDPRIAVFRDLKDRDLAARHGRFIAEGEFVVHRLLVSSFQTEAVFAAERREAEMAALVPPHVPLLLAPQQLMNQIVGYRFHTGVLASGIRRPAPKLADVLRPRGEAMLVVCPEISNSENLGGLIRVAAGFGATAVLLGERSCDPFFRQAIRVSMGTIFSLPVVQSENIHTDLELLKSMNVERIATVLDETATPLAASQINTGRIAILFGNEAQGLTNDHLAHCDHRVTIPMRLGTDSLNVAVSAGIILHHFVHVARNCVKSGELSK
jgi:tRNA G18 (ribose-2'-O)-methylase SpoU